MTTGVFLFRGSVFLLSALLGAGGTLLASFVAKRGADLTAGSDFVKHFR